MAEKRVHDQDEYLGTHVRIYRNGLSCGGVSDGPMKQLVHVDDGEKIDRWKP
jgi:hypothetical protein